MRRTTPVWALTLLLLGCGGSTDSDGASGGGTGGVDAGAGSGGTVSGGGGTVSGGGGTMSGGGGTVSGGGTAGAGASGGAGGAAGSAGAGGSGATPCLGLDYCSCKSSNQDCQVFSEACFCPCGVEPCEPDCTCACGGGNYLGCGPKSILTPGALDGVWLIGWSGGLNHYSWIRFSANGTADLLDGADISANAPFWPCNGPASWIFTAKLDTVGVNFPAGCGSTFDTFTFTLQSYAGYPPGAILSASVEQLSTSQVIEGYKYPSNQCNAQMTQCTPPF
jgi:hypothetical protein